MGTAIGRRQGSGGRPTPPRRAGRRSRPSRWRASPRRPGPREPERPELPPGEVAVHDDLVVGARVADVLHAEVVLVREEVGHRVVDLVAAGEVVRGDLALVDRGVPVLDPDPPPQHGVGVVRDVPDGEHASAPTCAARHPRARRRRRPARPSLGEASRGLTPTPATTRSAPRRSSAVTGAPSRRSTPCSRCRSAKTCATVGPSTRSSGRSAVSNTVTSQPASRAAAATSSPIQPAPTTAIRPPAPKASLSRSLSSIVRR